MEERIISKKNLKNWVDKLRQSYSLIGPKQTDQQDVAVDVIESPDQLLIESEGQNLPVLPAREYLAPQTENLFSYRITKEGLELKEFPSPLPSPQRGEGEEAKFIVFGIKSCDLKGVDFSDEYYQGQDFCDSYYESRRKSCIFINMVCLRPAPNCFCKDAWGGPFLKEGFDLQLTDLGDEFFVEVGSKQAQVLVSKFPEGFKEPQKGQRNRRKELASRVEGLFEKSIDLKAASKIVSEEKATESFWQGWVDKCITCGGCTYVCPTCYCFSVEDAGEEIGKRFRHWDSCMFEGYTRMAGDQNPRALMWQRFKRFFDHKLNDYPKRFDKIACVGCGRCQLFCPTNIGMANIVQDLTKANA